MTNGISENIFPVNVQNVKKDNSKDSMQSDDFISTMQQMCISDENSEDTAVQTENTEDGKEDISEPEINDYTAVLQNALYNMYIPVNQIAQADLSEISLDTDENLPLENVNETSADNVAVGEHKIIPDAVTADENVQPIIEDGENIILDIQIENTDAVINNEQPEKIESESIQSEKIESHSVQPDKTISDDKEPEKIISDSIQPAEIPNETMHNIQSENNQNVNSADDYNYKVQYENNYVYVNKDITVNGNNIQITEQSVADITENAVVQAEIKSETVPDKSTVSDGNSVLDVVPKNPESADNTDILSRPVKNQQESFNDSNPNNNNNNNSSFSENPFMHENAVKSDFYKNISQVKEFIKNNAEELNNPAKTDISELEKDMQEIDISQLQSSAMNNLKFADISSIMQKSVNQDGSIYNAAEIFKQTADGIIENMHGDADKFTVILNPEGLGKIEVTILKGDTSNVLSLAVSDAKTAEILSSDISSLHKALQHLNIEVSDIRVENPQESNQYKGYEEQFERDNPNNNQRRNHNRYNELSENDEDDDFSEDTIYSESQIMSYI